ARRYPPPASFPTRRSSDLTLRGDRMYAFFDKLVNVALARVRDFSGVSTKSFDGRGSYSIGLREQTIFPEIEFDKVDRIRGMQVRSEEHTSELQSLAYLVCR